VGLATASGYAEVSPALRARLEAGASGAARPPPEPIPISRAQVRARAPGLWTAWLTAAAALLLAAVGWWQYGSVSGRLDGAIARAEGAEQMARQAMEAVEGANKQLAETRELLTEANTALQSAAEQIASLQQQIAALNERLPKPEIHLADRLAQLRAAPGTVESAWAFWPAKTPQECGVEVPGADKVTGRVVWNNERQEGYLEFTGLPLNDAKQAQYQLWIIDPRFEEPIDGGVFDSQAGEFIVPITPKIRVHAANLFAVTVEEPGGVVKSKQCRRVVFAQPKG
jgi:anti-sigma-K factor RskA